MMLQKKKRRKFKKKNIEIESILDEIKGREFTFTLNSLQNNTDYFLKKYSKPYLIFTSPPPDLLNS